MIAAEEKRTTLKDIAQVSEFSVSTVSGVLNGNAGFSENTRKKVWDIANALNYTSNSQARNLRFGTIEAKRINTGIIIHITHMGSDNPLGNEFESQRSLLLAWEAGKMGLFPVSYWYYQKKGFRCPPVINGTVDGAIVGTPHLEVVQALKDKLPIVLMNVPFSRENAGVPMVNVDYRQGLMKLFSLMQQEGHRQIAVIAPDDLTDGESSPQMILREMKKILEFYNLIIGYDCSRDKNITPETHEAVLSEIVEELIPQIKQGTITAIVAPCHSWLNTLYEILIAKGIKIPEDVSLAGTQGGIKEPLYDITSVCHDWTKLTRTSLKVLDDLIKGREINCQEFLVSATFFKGSTLKRRPGTD